LPLDAVTASIDGFTERKIQEALRELLKGRICLAIAQRLATVRSADKIVVLRHGRIVEQGTHQESIEMGGLYAHPNSCHHASFDDLAGANDP
jgi:ATP-binding cassette, subfamily B, multidrug efflux pump